MHKSTKLTVALAVTFITTACGGGSNEGPTVAAVAETTVTTTVPPTTTTTTVPITTTTEPATTTTTEPARTISRDTEIAVRRCIENAGLRADLRIRVVLQVTEAVDDATEACNEASLLLDIDAGVNGDSPLNQLRVVLASRMVLLNFLSLDVLSTGEGDPQRLEELGPPTVWDKTAEALLDTIPQA